MKRRLPGWKKGQERKKQAQQPHPQLLRGEDVQNAIQALLDRMERHPERFMFEGDFEDYSGE